MAWRPSCTCCSLLMPRTVPGLGSSGAPVTASSGVVETSSTIVSARARYTNWRSLIDSDLYMLQDANFRPLGFLSRSTACWPTLTLDGRKRYCHRTADRGCPRIVFAFLIVRHATLSRICSPRINADHADREFPQLPNIVVFLDANHNSLMLSLEFSRLLNIVVSLMTDHKCLMFALLP